MMRINRADCLLKNILVNFQPLGELKPPWLGGDGQVPIILPEIYKNSSEGEVLAYFISKQERLPAIVRTAKETVFNFDPAKTINFLLNEAYFVPKRPVYKFLPFNYQLVPGPTRRFVKQLTVLGARRKLAAEGFPSWPIEASVETMRYILSPTKPYMSWPEGKKFAAIFSHDIDTHEGFANIDKFCAIEKKRGILSSWFVVASLFKNHAAELKVLKNEGFEIGCHGYLHDNKLIGLPKDKMKESIICCSQMIDSLGVLGFRSPALFHSKDLFEALDGVFMYDSSVPDTEVFLQYAPRSGCCSIFPYKTHERLLEIPITMPLDSTLLALGLSPDEMLEIWKNKINWIKKVGGVAHFLNHAESYYSGNGKMLGLYQRLVDYVCADSDCWIARASDVADISTKEKELTLCLM